MKKTQETKIKYRTHRENQQQQQKKKPHQKNPPNKTHR